MSKSRRRNMLILVFVLLTFSLSAQVRLDLAVDVPFYFGIQYGGENIGALSEFTFVFPEAGVYYLLGEGSLKVGLGARIFTLILESIAWPNVLVELDLDPIVVSAQAGGGAFGLFGLYNEGFSGPVLIGDLAAAYKIAESFRLGVGAFFIAETDPEITFSDEGVIPFSIYAFGKFTLDL